MDGMYLGNELFINFILEYFLFWDKTTSNIFHSNSNPVNPVRPYLYILQSQSILDVVF